MDKRSSNCDKELRPEKQCCRTHETTTLTRNEKKLITKMFVQFIENHLFQSLQMEEISSDVNVGGSDVVTLPEKN